VNRTVIDTNVVLSSQKSTHPSSPTQEVIRRWKTEEFNWLYTNDIIEEYVEKLLKHGVSPRLAKALVVRLRFAGEFVPITYFHLKHYPADPDDIIFLLAALNGGASHLVTYDDHLHEVSPHYPEFITCRPLEFLAVLRACGQP
jgi:predicted nucleic acid-binding protein